jgi:hypothetical protein
LDIRYSVEIRGGAMRASTSHKAQSRLGAESIKGAKRASATDFHYITIFECRCGLRSCSRQVGANGAIARGAKKAQRHWLAAYHTPKARNANPIETITITAVASHANGVRVFEYKCLWIYSGRVNVTFVVEESPSKPTKDGGA